MSSDFNLESALNIYPRRKTGCCHPVFKYGLFYSSVRDLSAFYLPDAASFILFFDSGIVDV